MDLEWMAWTPITAGFFATIAVILISMTIWEVCSPTIERKGLLPISTTRGDRLFIGLLGSGYIHLMWLGLTDLNLWIATAISVCFLAALLRWG